MPIKRTGTRNKPQVTITLNPEDLAYLDRLSGDESRSRAAREIIQAARLRDEQEAEATA